MTPVLSETIFVLPDIGGYTRFMLHNKKTPERAQEIITQLMEAMLHEVEIPLHISEVEGDALFMYAHKEDDLQWQKDLTLIGATLEHFFAAFYEKMRELLQSNLCECNDCAELTNLRIKIIVHKGAAIIDRLDRFTTITGVDAIIAHRLLKNHLRGDYLFVTKTAFEECRFAEPERFKPHREEYDDVGVVDGFVAHIEEHRVSSEH